MTETKGQVSQRVTAQGEKQRQSSSWKLLETQLGEGSLGSKSGRNLLILYADGNKPKEGGHLEVQEEELKAKQRQAG